MKKLLLFFLLLSQSVLLSQTVLNSYLLNLNKPLENGQLLNVEDVKTHEMYVFATDNESINILKYNSSLFLKSQFKDSIRSEHNRTLIGYSLNEDGNPTLYWESQNHRNIRIIKYNLEAKTSNAFNFEFTANTGNIITSFQKNNTFYILSKEKDQEHLLLFEFRNEKCEIKMFNFSALAFENEKGQRVSFSALIQYHYPIEKIDLNDFTPLEKSEKKSKMYVLDDRILFTLDYNINRTQVLNLDFKTSEVTEKLFETPVTANASRTTNSFFLDNKLFQLSTNADQFLFSIKDYDSGKNIKNISITKNDTITFKNSPLFLQINGERPQKLKTTSKFLKQLSTVNAALSAFKDNQNTFVTFGGFLEYQTLIPSFNYGQPSAFENASKMVFFDSMLNSDFEFVKNNQMGPLAIDNLYYFMSKNKNITLENIIKLKDSYVLGYYDLTSKSYTMRKFVNDIMDENPGNPIMNKAEFSKSLPLKRN